MKTSKELEKPKVQKAYDKEKRHQRWLRDKEALANIKKEYKKDDLKPKKRFYSKKNQDMYKYIFKFYTIAVNPITIKSIAEKFGKKEHAVQTFIYKNGLKRIKRYSIRQAKILLKENVIPEEHIRKMMKLTIKDIENIKKGVNDVQPIERKEIFTRNFK